MKFARRAMIALTVVWTASFAFAAGDDAPDAARPEPATVVGKVVPLARVLAERKLAADSLGEPPPVVLATDDGRFVPLICDDASRALFLDERLGDRRAEIKGLRHAGLPYLQVLTFRVEEEGALRTPEYYCDVCRISVRFPQVCSCCQGPMELRYKPMP